MNLSDPIDRAEQAAADALHAMARLRVAPTPNNYLIWYSHCTRRYPDLSQVLQAMEAAGEPFTEVDCAEIFERFFGIAQEARLIDDSCVRITKVMTELLGQVSAVEQNTGDYGDALKSFGATLAHGVDRDHLRRLLAEILGMTRATQDRVRGLEQTCAAAGSGIMSLQQNLAQARRDAYTDALTGIANRRFFDDQLRTAAATEDGEGLPFSLLIMDIDHFKAFNDTFGHQVGDRVLKVVAQILTRSIKGRDLAARYGGEEFAVLLPQTPLEGARLLAEQIRTSVDGNHFRLKSSGRSLGQITLSIGCAEYLPGEPVSSLVGRADHALYRAKREGRNRVAAADPEQVCDHAAA